MYYSTHSLCSFHVTSFLLQAAHRKLHYPHYAWLIYDWYPDRWWTEEVANETIDGCPDEVLEAFLIQSRALLIHILPEPDDSDKETAAGIVRGVYIYISAIQLHYN